MLTDYVKISSVDDVKDGEMKSFTVGETQLLVAKLNGKYYAINNVCSHFYALLSDGELLPDECRVRCPLHDSRFDLATGEPAEPPAESAVEVYGVRVVGDKLWVGPKG